MTRSEPVTSPIEEAERLAAAGERKAAVASLERHLAAEPRAFRGYLTLGRILYDDGQYRAAVRITQAAERVDPLGDDFAAIQQAMQAGQAARAEDIARDMLRREPGHPRAVFTLAHLSKSRGRHEDSVAALEAGLAVSPANVVLRQMLVGALEDCGAFRRAIATARHLAEVDDSFASHLALAALLFRLGQHDDALAVSDRAELHAGGDPARRAEVSLLRGQLLRILGQRAGSIAALRASLDLRPRSGAAWWALADMKTYRFSPDDRERMARLAEDATVDRESRCMAAFALAKAYELDGETGRSMDIYHRANGLHPRRRFDAARFAAAVTRLIDAFDGDALARRAPKRRGRPAPIFIVGMPRSGSTLIEQILASHSQVEGTIESLILPSVKRRVHLHCVDRLGGEYLDRLGEVASEDLEAFGRMYLEESAILHTGRCAFFTDKLPYNFEHVGLILKILPDAVVIDARRNPLDCGLSIYRQHFARGSEFSYDLASIGAYYTCYLKIMDHWDRVLPGRVLRVQYEDLVRHPERVIRGILDHVGLPFEAGCLAFHETQRAVRTASSEQVRQPIFTSGIGAWREVEAHLAPLASSLGTATLARFADLLE